MDATGINRISHLNLQTFQDLADVNRNATQFLQAYDQLPAGITPEEMESIGVFIGVALMHRPEGEIISAKVLTIHSIGSLAIKEGDLITAGSARLALREEPSIRARIASIMLGRQIKRLARDSS
jgi:hypothetical protein